MASVNGIHTVTGFKTLEVNKEVTDEEQIVGKLINVGGDNILTLLTSLTLNDSSGISFSVYGVDDGNEYLIASDIDVTDSEAYAIDIGTFIYVYVKVVAETEGASPAVISVKWNSGYRVISSGSSIISSSSDDYPPTTSSVLVTEQALTDTYADFGDPTSCLGYDVLSLKIKADCNDSEDVTLRILELTAIDGTDRYELETDGTKTLWSGTSADFNKSYSIDVQGAIAVQLQAKAVTVGATAGNLTINTNKA